jgi:nitrate/TMAO reductase-like tetraheme cytochrome c subunit
MKKVDVTWKIFSMYMLVILFMLVASTAFGQVNVVQFNANWNKTNDVEWCTSKKLNDCKVSYIDIGENPDAQKKYEVVVVPTIIIFNNNEEVKRFQADLSFKMTATREELQEYIDELLMEDF